MTVRDRVKSRVREAVTIGAVAGAAALGVGVAVAATSPVLVAAPQSATVPPAAEGELSAPPPRVKGYTILRPSSLVLDTPSGLRILLGTGMAVTGLPDFAALAEQVHERSTRPAAVGNGHAGSNEVVPTASTGTVALEPDFPGRGEEHRSERADPKRSERAEAQAYTLSESHSAKDGQSRGRNG